MLIPCIAKGLLNLTRNLFSIVAGSIIICTGISSCSNSDSTEVDVLIVGGGASGVSAAVQASRLGVTVLVAEESTWLGGMLTSAGVSAVDGNYSMPAGIFGEFRDSLAAYYGGLDSLKTGWVSKVLFEPSVGNRIFKNMVAACPGVDVKYETTLKHLVKEENGCWRAVLTDASGNECTVKARVLIDGTELGDIAKLAGVKYDIGMESRAVTHEDIAPESSNSIIQDLTMVAVLKDYGYDVTITEPEDYDLDEFACTAINDLCVNPVQPDRMWSTDMMITYGKLPNGKYMINWPIEGNDYYVNMIEMSREQRDSALVEAKAHTLRYIYFLQSQLGFNTLGLADDEFPTADRLPFIPYHRESRRIHGKVRFDLNDVMDPYAVDMPVYRTGIAVGDYPVDHHHHAYSGVDELPNLYFHPVPSYCLPLGSIIPDSVENLLVTEKSISVSNIVNGSSRLQPVVVQVGQAAGATAALAVINNINVSDVSVRDVQDVILEAGGYIMPFIDVAKDDSRFKAYQRIGASGILRGEGRSISWTNETRLRDDEPLLVSELADFVKFYNMSSVEAPGHGSDCVTLSMAVKLVAAAAGHEVDAVEILSAYGLTKTSDDDTLTRGEFALIVDSVLNPFKSRQVDIRGRYI